MRIFEVIMSEKKNPDKSADRSLRDSPPPPLPFAHHIKQNSKSEEGVNISSEGRITIDGALKMLDEMKKLHDEIDKLLQEALKASGLTPEYISTYLENPSNFNGAEEWNSVQRQIKELNDSMKTPKQLQNEAEEGKKTSSFHGEQSHDPKIAKERRIKTAGQRRNWLPMR